MTALAGFTSQARSVNMVSEMYGIIIIIVVWRDHLITVYEATDLVML